MHQENIEPEDRLSNSSFDDNHDADISTGNYVEKIAAISDDVSHEININIGNYNENVRGVYYGEVTENSVRVLPSDRSLENLYEAAKLNLEQLEKNYDQSRQESSRFFWLMITSSGLGFIVIIFSILLLISNKIAAGVLTTTASVIPHTISFLFFKKDTDLRKSIEKYHAYLINSHKTSSMIDLAETVTNLEEKDHLKKLIVLKILEFDQHEFTSSLQDIALREQQSLQDNNNSVDI